MLKCHFRESPGQNNKPTSPFRNKMAPLKKTINTKNRRKGDLRKKQPLSPTGLPGKESKTVKTQRNEKQSLQTDC